MPVTRIAAGLSLTFLLATGWGALKAQGRPSFEGQWKLDAAKTNASGRQLQEVREVLGDLCEISQSSDELIVLPQVPGASALHFRLDGGQSPNPAQAATGLPETVTYVKWRQNDELMLNMTHVGPTLPDRPSGRAVARVLAKGADGSLMVRVADASGPSAVVAYQRVQH